MHTSTCSVVAGYITTSAHLLNEPCLKINTSSNVQPCEWSILSHFINDLLSKESFPSSSKNSWLKKGAWISISSYFGELILKSIPVSSAHLYNAGIFFPQRSYLLPIKYLFNTLSQLTNYNSILLIIICWYCSVCIAPSLFVHIVKLDLKSNICVNWGCYK